jgi:hypothetical protein
VICLTFYVFCLKQCICFFFFCDMSTQEGGGGIRTNDLRFMRRGSQPIELLLGTNNVYVTVMTNERVCICSKVVATIV